VGDPQVVQVPREVSAALGPVVGLDTLNGDRECPPELLDKVDGKLDRAVVVELQDPESGGLIDGGEQCWASRT
jgi:hypothetical protein